MSIHPLYKLLILLVLLLGLASSATVSYWVKGDIEARDQQQFFYYCEEIRLKITARLKAHEQTLLGGVALFDASDSVERQEWKAYAKRLRISEHFNGIQGLGFAVWIPAAQLARHEAKIRTDIQRYHVSYQVHPQGNRPAYTSIIYLEPFSGRNLRAFGYDMYSEPVRRAAMARARDENSIILSGKVILVQETTKNVQAGTLMYAPVYAKGQPLDTVEHRRAALKGWVYSPFRMTDLLNNIVSSTDAIEASEVHLRIYDGNHPHPDHLLYDTHPGQPFSHTALTIVYYFNGALWTLQFENCHTINDLDKSKLWITASTGVIISLLLFLLSHSYLTMRLKAARIARQLTKELQESETHLKLSQQYGGIGSWEVDLLTGQQMWSDTTFQLVKLPPKARPTLDDFFNLIHPDDRLRVHAAAQAHFEQQTKYDVEYRMILADGEMRWMRSIGQAQFADDGKPLKFIGITQDITERKQTEQQLRIAATIFEAQEGMLICDANTIILNVNQAFSRITGYNAADVIGKTPRLLYSGRHDKAFYAALWLSIEQTGTWQGEIWNRHKNGQIHPQWLTITAVKAEGNQKVTHYVATLTDITERKAAEASIHQLAFYDPLTQLANRRLLQERLQNAIHVCSHHGSQMAVLMLDLDKFKAVNDTLGHAAGDELLKQVAKRIKTHVRDEDLVVRLGGDEFVVLIENAHHLGSIARVATALITALSEPFTLGSHQAFIGTSVGIAIYPQHGVTIEALMDNADVALYRAKDNGRGCFAYFSEKNPP